MAGFVALYDVESSPFLLAKNFQNLLDLTCHFKDLPIPVLQARGQNCIAAKIDAPSTLHHKIVFDEASESWILAAGTVVALEGNNDPTILLKELLVEFVNNDIKALEKIDGHFGLVIYDGREQSLSILTDPIGLFAIYYARKGKQVLVSTSALAIAQQTQSKADQLAIECFLRAGRGLGEKTLWEEVKRVLPATLIKITPEKFEEIEYWFPKIDENIAKLPMKEALEIADEKISVVYDKLFSREGKVWADLTGGFDSRVTTMYLSKFGIPFTAHCLGPSWHPDVKISEETAKSMGWEYIHRPLPKKWDQEQVSWVRKATMFGDGNLNIVDSAGSLNIQYENSLIHDVHISGAGVDEWRLHWFAPKVIIPTKNTQLDYEEILNSQIFYIPVAAMRSNRSLEVKNEIKDYLVQLQQDYLDWGVLARADLIFMKHQNPVHAGSYLSSQSSFGRTFLPFCFKDLKNFGLSLKNSWRLNYHYSLIRNLIQKNSPALAKTRTVIGGPVGPMRLSNSYKFLPLGKYLLDHFLHKSKISMTGKMKKLNLISDQSDNGLIPREKKWLEWAVSEDLLNPSKMLSGELYNLSNLSEIISQERTGSIRSEEFLQKVLTVEMALRESNTGL